MLSTFARLRSILGVFKTAEPTAHLGRWALKHDQDECEKYILNSYADPGYPNSLKSIWIEERNQDNVVADDKTSKTI